MIITNNNNNNNNHSIAFSHRITDDTELSSKRDDLKKLKGSFVSVCV